MIVTDVVRRYVISGAAIAAIVAAAWAGNAVRGWIDKGEIKRIDDERIAAVKAAAELIAATEYAKAESERLASKWKDGAYASKAKSDQLLAAVVTDRERLAVRVRELESKLSGSHGDTAAAEVPQDSASGVDGDPKGVNGYGDGQDLDGYAETCERLRVGLIAARDYLTVIGAIQPGELLGNSK